MWVIWNQSSLRVAVLCVEILRFILHIYSNGGVCYMPVILHYREKHALLNFVREKRTNALCQWWHLSGVSTDTGRHKFIYTRIMVMLIFIMMRLCIFQTLHSFFIHNKFIELLEYDFSLDLTLIYSYRNQNNGHRKRWTKIMCNTNISEGTKTKYSLLGKNTYHIAEGRMLYTHICVCCVHNDNNEIFRGLFNSLTAIRTSFHTIRYDTAILPTPFLFRDGLISNTIPRDKSSKRERER